MEWYESEILKVVFDGLTKQAPVQHFNPCNLQSLNIIVIHTNGGIMCCALTIDVEVDFSKTIVYAAETLHPEMNRIVHVLGYQNTVQNNILKNHHNFSDKLPNFVTNLFNLFG